MSAATQFGFSTDLKLTEIIGHEKNGTPITDNKKYANASMMFYIGYLIGTYPMMYLTQRFSISRVVASATLLWGAVLMSTAACYNYPGIMVNRLFLGILESAVAPSFTVLVTFWWTREEQALRTSLWYACVGVATMVSPLINYGLGQTHGSLPSWKPMFLILGAVTILWSAVLFFCLPDNPMTSRRLTDAEKEIAKYRLQRNNAGAISHEFNKAQFFEAFRDYKVYSSALIVMLTGVPSGALGTFGTMVINGFGFNHFESLALTCPIGAVTALSILIVGTITRRWRNTRYICIVICASISIGGALICWLGPRDNKGLLFAGIFLVAIQVASSGLAVSLSASNISGHTSKSPHLISCRGTPYSNAICRKVNCQCFDLCWILRWKRHRPCHLWRISRPRISCRVYWQLYLPMWRGCHCSGYMLFAAQGEHEEGQENRPSF